MLGMLREHNICNCIVVEKAPAVGVSCWSWGLSTRLHKTLTVQASAAGSNVSTGQPSNLDGMEMTVSCS